jgi:hypothetical protein
MPDRSAFDYRLGLNGGEVDMPITSNRVQPLVRQSLCRQSAKLFSALSAFFLDWSKFSHYYFHFSGFWLTTFWK